MPCSCTDLNPEISPHNMIMPINRSDWLSPGRWSWVQRPCIGSVPGGQLFLAAQQSLLQQWPVNHFRRPSLAHIGEYFGVNTAEQNSARSQLRRTTGIVLILCLIHSSLDFKIVFEENSVYICKHIYTQAPAGDAWGIWVYLQFVILQIQENAQIHEQISISSYCKRHCLNHPAVSNSFKACGKIVRFPNPPGLAGLTGSPVLKRFWNHQPSYQT